MAAMLISRPAPNTNTVVTNFADSVLQLGFNTADATLTKENNNLVFTFEDGSAVTLQDFYAVYTKENMPTFQIGDAQVAGADFFAAFDADLAPAAGPAAAATPAGGRFHDYGTGTELINGLDSLGGLAGTRAEATPLEPLTFVNPDGTVTTDEAAAAVDTPAAVAMPSPAVAPNVTLAAGPQLPDATLTPSSVTVSEAGMAQGTDAAADSETAQGTFSVAFSGNSGSIVLGNGALSITVAPDGTPTLSANSYVDADGNTIAVTDVATDGAGNATVTYTFTLGNAVQHAAGSDLQDNAFAIPVTVNSDNGAAAINGQLSVSVEDDTPVLEFINETNEMVILSGDKYEGTLKDMHMDFGADGPAQDASIKLVLTFPDSGTTQEITVGADGTAQLPYDDVFTLVKDSDGNFTNEFTIERSPQHVGKIEPRKSIPVPLDENGHIVPRVHTGVTIDTDLGGFRFPEYDIRMVIEDADGDTAEANLGTVCPLHAPAPEVLLTVYEAGLRDGADGADHSEFTSLPLPAGCTVVGGEDTQYQGTHGVVKMVNGVWTYELTDPLTHGFSGKDALDYADPVYVTIKDALGNTFEIPLQVKVVDDVPTVDFNQQTITITTGGIPYEGHLTLDFGADGAAASAAIKLTVNGTEHTLDESGSTTLANGAIFTLKKDANGDFTKEYTIEQPPYDYSQGPLDTTPVKIELTVTDSDGDPSAPTTITYAPDAATPRQMTGALGVKEAGMADGTDAASNSEFAAVSTVPAGFTIVGDANTVFAGQYGEVKIVDG